MLAPQLTPDPRVATFLGAMFEHLPEAQTYIEVRSIEDRQGGEVKVRRWLATASELIEQLPSRMRASAAQRAGIFYGVLPRVARKAGRASDTRAGMAAWADFDFHDFVGGEAEVRARLAAFPLPPTAIIRSGHGLHAYWLMHEPEEPGVLSELSERIARKLDGDNVFDAARIMRIPGTINWKDPEHPVDVVIEELDVDRRYSPGDFDDVLPPLDATPRAGARHLSEADVTLADELPQAVQAILRRSKRIRGLFAGTGKPDKGKHGESTDQTSSGYDWSCLLALIAKGVTDPSELATVLWHRPDGTARQKGAAAIARTVARALTFADQAKADKAVDRFEPVEGMEHLTELGLARRLVHQHGSDLRHVHAWRRWLCWDGTRWSEDHSAEVMRRAKASVAALQDEARAAPTPKARAVIRDFAHDCEKVRVLRAAVELASSEPGVPARFEELDADPWLLNVRNGTVDLRTGELQPHRREDRITKRADVDYDPDATAPRWRAFLERVLPIAEVRDFVQRSVGYSLTGSVREQCFWILWGGGRNGKTTFIKCFLDALGDYAQSAPAETFMAQRQTGVPNDVARLRGTRFAATLETDASGRLDEAKLKSLTGGDRLVARYMRADWFEFDPTFKLWLGTNHKPQVRGTDYALWRRIRLIPFTETIADHECDPDLTQKLAAERAGVLRWAVEGCLAWQRGGLQTPPAICDATQDYRDSQDVIGAFLEEQCVVSPHARVTARDVYGAFAKWAEELGEHVCSQRIFGDRLSERGFTRGRGRGGRTVYEGVGLLCGDGTDPRVKD